MVSNVIISRHELIGRKQELDELKQILMNAIAGNGSSVFISGEAGIGKTRILEEFQNFARTRNVQILSAAAAVDTVHPFLIFSKALAGKIDRPLFHEQEYKFFIEIFAVNPSGLLVAKAAPGQEELDADIFAGMLTAVQSFVRDSFDKTAGQSAGLGRLEYGDMKILIEHGDNIFLTAVFRGAEHPDMKDLLRRTVRDIEDRYGTLLETWSGNMADVTAIQDIIFTMARVKFLVKRDLDGVKLENERIRIADRVLEMLVGMAEQRPIILLLEDLHWADESSLFVLNYLSRNIRKENILIMGTMRPGESEILQRTMDRMRDEEIVTEISINKLGTGSVHSLIDEIYPQNEFPPEFIDSIASQCEGNPFFVIELLRQMQEENNIAMEDGRYTIVSENYSIPSSVEEVVFRRLEMLEPDAMAMAEYASCIGREFSKEAAMSVPFLTDPDSALKKLHGFGILVPDNDVIMFTHAIFQDTTYRTMGQRWKSVYHKSLGEYYESAWKNNLDEVLYDIARHFSRTNVPEKAYLYCIRAGEKAENAFAPEQAAEFYNLALDAITRLKQDSETKSRTTLVHERLGDIHSLTGDYQKAIENYVSAMDIETETQSKANIHRKIAAIYGKMGDYEMGRKECQKGLAILENSHSMETAGLLGVEAWIYIRTGDYDKASTLLTRGLEISRELNDKKEIAQAHHSLGSIGLFKCNYGDALEHLENAHRLRKEIGDTKGLSGTLNNIGIVYHDGGELDRAIEYYEQSLEMFKKIGDKNSIAGSLNNIGEVYEYKGELEKALEYYKQSHEILVKIGDKHGVAMALNNMGIVFHDQGDLDKALEYWEESLDIRKHIGDQHGIAASFNNIGDVYQYKGQMDMALDYYNKGLKISLEIGDKRQAVYNYCGMAEIHIELGDPLTALADADEALKISTEIGAKTEEGISHRVFAMAYLGAGELDRSNQEFENAKELLEEVEDEKELARTFHEYALLLREKGDLTGAREYLETALKMFEDVGMKIWIDKTKPILMEFERMDGAA